MGRMLGQLLCARCRNRFWPEMAAGVVVLCPGCGAGHANPEPWQLPGSPFVANEHVKRMWEWTQRYWVGQVPYAGFKSPLGVTASTSGELNGYSFWAGRTASNPEHSRAGRHTFIFVPVLPPPSKPRLPANWTWAQAGVWAYYTRAVLGRELVASVLPTLIASLRAAGVEPLFALEEVEDPTPLDPSTHERELAVASDPRADAALESHPIRCGRCGAASTAAELVAGRCLYCAAPPSLDPELERALRQYRRRVHVAQLQASTGGFHDAFFGQLPPPPMPGSVVVVCVHCGAPNQHRLGALHDRCRSCDAGLIPEASARRALSAEAAREGHRRYVSEQLHRQLAWGRTVEGLRTVHMVLFGLGTVPFALIMVVVCLYALTQGKPVALIGAGINAGFVFGLVAIGVKLHRNKKRASATWRPRLTTLAHQLGARGVGTSLDLRRWAEAWWNDRLAPWWLQDKAERGVIITQLAGFPVAVTVAIEVVGGGLGLVMGTSHLRPHAVVLLGATLPRDVVYWAKRGEAVKTRDEFERADFHLELRSGGLTLQAGGRALNRMRRQPDRLAALAPIVFRLVQLAHQLRAEAPRGIEGGR